MNIEQFKKILAERGYIFDVETGGLASAYHRMFSYAFMPVAGKPEDAIVRFQHWQGIGGDKEFSRWSYFSKKLFEETLASDPEIAKAYAYERSGQGLSTLLHFFEESLPKDFAEIGKAGNILVGHNITFDLNALEAELLAKGKIEELNKLKAAFGLSEQQRLRAIVDPENIINQKLFSYKIASQSVGKGTTYATAYKQYISAIAERIKTGNVAVYDTATAMRLMMGMAQEKGLINFGGDLFTGTKVDIIARALGLQQQAHDWTDILYTQKILKWQQEAFKELEQGFLSKKNLKVLEFIRDIQEPLAKANFERRLAEMAAYDVALQKGWLSKEDIYFAGSEENLNKYLDYFAKGKKGKQPKFLYHFYDIAGQGPKGPTKDVLSKPYFKASSVFDIIDEKLFNKNSFYAKYKDLTKEYAYKKYSEYYFKFQQAASAEEVFQEINEITNIDKIISQSKNAQSILEEANSAFKWSGLKKGLLIGGLAIAGIGLYAYLSGKRRYEKNKDVEEYTDSVQSSRDLLHGRSNINIEGLHPGGGINQYTVDTFTDFGSGWQAFKNKGIDLLQRLSTVTVGTHGPLHSIGIIKAHKDLVGKYPTFKEFVSIFLHDIGYLKTGVVNDLRHPELGASIARRLFGQDMANYILGHSATYAKEFNIPLSELYILDKVWHNYVPEGLLRFAGKMEVGSYKLAGEDYKRVLEKSQRMLRNIKDYLHGRTLDNIEGLHPGGGINEDIIKAMTDFGSGLLMFGGLSKAFHNDDIFDEEINKAEDIPAYQLIRGSKIGLPYHELYKELTQANKEPSEYVEATARTGTALHKYLEARGYELFPKYQSEVLVYEPSAQITGHIDEIIAGKISDIKTVEAWKLQKVRETQQPYPMHRAQVMFYMGATGLKRGQIKYVNRESPSDYEIIPVNFNAREYEALLRKARAVRRQIAQELAQGLLDEANLPKTASLERLIEHEKNKPTPEEEVERKEEYWEIYTKELEKLKSIKRGMPSSGPGYERIMARNKRVTSHYNNHQGLGLFIYENRNQHHVM